jgi:uncharacterized lipoprotein NlpE involved in copper resistance
MPAGWLLPVGWLKGHWQRITLGAGALGTAASSSRTSSRHPAAQHERETQGEVLAAGIAKGTLCLLDRVAVCHCCHCCHSL